MKKYDLTQDRILSKLLLVALPIMGTQLMQMAYNLTDMFWLGRLSSDAVAASGTAGMFMWLSMAFVMIGRMGSEIGVSQNLGRGDENSAKSYSHNAVFLAAAFSLLYGLTAIIFSRQLVSVFNIREAGVAADAASYLSIIGVGFPASVISGALTGTFNGSGNSRMSFIANAAGLVVNIILDPVLIFVMGIGIKGAAVATVIAQYVVLAVFVIAVKKSRERPFQEYRFIQKPEKAKLAQILKWTLPIALESMLFTLLSMTITRVITSFGAGAFAAHRVCSQIESLSWLIGGGFGTAITAFVGQNYGAGKWRRIHKGYKISFLTLIIWGVITTCILFFGGRFLFSIFLADNELMDIGETYLKILAMAQIPQCIEAISAGAFRGTGKTIPPSITSITCNTLRVPLSYALSKTSLGLNGVWLGFTIGAAARGLSVLVWYLLYAKKLPKTDGAALAEG